MVHTEKVMTVPPKKILHNPVLGRKIAVTLVLF